MRKGLVFVLGIALSAGAGDSAYGQNPSRPGAVQQKATLVSVHVTGTSRYNDDDIAAATGLKIGSMVTPEDFKAAADKISTSGVFDEVRYAYRPAGTGYAVDFRVTDASQFLPVVFDNFVWFSQRQLVDAVHQRVPLFKGELPGSGDMEEQVADALQGVLAEHGIPGQVRFVPESKLGGDVQRGVFTIDGVDVRIAAVDFPGAAAMDGGLLEHEASKLMNANYESSIVRQFAELNVKPLYVARGYLKVAFAEPVIELVSEDSRQPAVAVSIGVNEGAQYRLSGIEWAGNGAFSAEDLSKAMKAKTGAVLDGAKFQEDIERVQQLYGSKGYLRASVSPRESFDEAQKTVSYRMDVQEGAQYRLGSVDLSGLDKLTMARLREAWKLLEDEPFDTGYEREYMNSIRPLLAPNISVAVSHEMHDQTKTVDVTMKFIVHADKVIR